MPTGRPDRPPCRLCDGEAPGGDAWVTHAFDCPYRLAPVTSEEARGRRTDIISAEMGAIAERRRRQAERRRHIQEASKRVAAGPPSPRSKHTPYYVRDRQLELFQQAVDFLNSQPDEQ